MARVERFEDLVAWQKARQLRQEISALTRTAAVRREFDYRSQVGRAATSVMSNIAEGFERGGRAEFAQFLSVAKGSCAEVRSLLYVALDEGFIDVPTFNRISNLAEEVGRVIGGLRAAVARQRDDARGASTSPTRPAVTHAGSSVLSPQPSVLNPGGPP